MCKDSIKTLSVIDNLTDLSKKTPYKDDNCFNKFMLEVKNFKGSVCNQHQTATPSFYEGTFLEPQDDCICSKIANDTCKLSKPPGIPYNICVKK